MRIKNTKPIPLVENPHGEIHKPDHRQAYHHKYKLLNSDFVGGRQQYFSCNGSLIRKVKFVPTSRIEKKMAKKKNPCQCKNGERVLLVEGKNDCHVIMNLCQAHDVPETFCIHDWGSDDGVLKRLGALILEAKSEAIGIVLDADIPENKPDIKIRWQQVVDKLKKYGYTLPAQPDKKGTIHPNFGKYPRVGIWLMPNNQETGMLEDFLKQLALPETLATAQSCVKCARRRKVTQFKEAYLSKAEIYTYLAWQDEPGKPFGIAITAHTLHPHTEIAYIFTDWLNRLMALT